jgi:hypothetical protein
LAGLAEDEVTRRVAGDRRVVSIKAGHSA